MTERPEISERLDELVSTVEADPHLADRVLARGRQLKKARRTIYGAALALAVVLTAGTALTGWVRSNEEPTVPARETPPREPSPVLVERLTGEVRGDLAEDTAFIAEAESLWREQAADALSWTTSHYPQQTLSGPPNVHAAFSTPAGDVAIITQAVEGTRREAISGIVGSDEQGTTRVLTVGNDDGKLLSYLVGPEPGVVVVLDGDWGEVWMVGGLEVDDTTGRPSHRSVEIPLDDKIGIVELGSEGGPFVLDLMQNAMSQDPIHDRDNQPIPIERIVPAGPWTDDGADPPDRDSNPGQLLSDTWSETDESSTPIVEVGEIDDQALLREAWQRVFGAIARAGQLGYWTTVDIPLAAFALPDGRTALVTDLNHTGAAPHMYAVVFDGDHPGEIVYGGPVDIDSALPIAIRLPDEQGWVVFDHQSEFRYRDHLDGDWMTTTSEPGAALLPDTAVQVEVTSVEGTTEVVDLVG